LQWFGDIDTALGLKPGELPMTIKAWLERIHPEDQARLEGAVELHRKSKKKIYEEYRVKKNDGTWLYWIDRGVPVLDDKGKPVRWIGVCIDITTHKQAQNERRRYSELLKETERIAELGGWEYDLITKTSFWTEQMYALYGVPLDFDITDIKLISDFFSPPFKEIILNSFQSAIELGIPYDHKLKFINARGEELWVRAIGEPIFADGKVIKIRGNLQDISSQKAAEEEIKASLNEKEVLLKEIHHRVKNNMQIISSLLRLQQGRIQDKKGLEIFQESQNQIRSMALIHEKLYQSKDFANIDFGIYIESFSRHLYVAYQIDTERIKLTIAAQKVLLDVNQAIPCGLILNELVSNSLKHAFPGNQKGEVKVTLSESPSKQITLSVSDNGIGIKPGVNFNNPDTLGIQLVRDLSNQIQATLSLDRKSGAKVKIVFSR